MTLYATALSTRVQWAPTGGSNYVPGVIGTGDVHAVEWPDPDGRAWGEMATLCGRSTHGMELEEHMDPTEWPKRKWVRSACRACNRVVKRA
jgi:hypothetical protein